MTITTKLETVPKPIEVGSEVELLRRFHRDCTWEGWIHEGGMGPGTPEMKGVGRATFKPIQGGRWVEGDFEQDQYLEDGTFVLTWQLHWVSWWAPRFGEYRAAMVDDYGNAEVYRGYIDGDRLVFESLPDALVQLRFTWDASDPRAMTWRNEMAGGDGSWTLIEEYLLVPIATTQHGSAAVTPERGDDV